MFPRRLRPVTGPTCPLPSVNGMRKHYWFARKRTSYAGLPITWQGWATVVALAVVVATAAALLPWLASLPVVAAAVAAFLVVSVAKGPIYVAWHWAGQDD
jgi:hypothetical protein